MADQTFSFLNGATYNSSGQAQNSTAQNEVASLTGNASANTYNSYVAPNPASPVSSNLVTTNGLSFPSAPSTDNGSGLVASAVAGTTPPPSTTPPASTTPNLDMATTGDYTQDPAYQAALSKYNQSVSDFSNAADNLPSQANLLTQEQQNSGATAALATVNQLRTQLAQSQAAYNNAYQNAEVNGIKSGTPAVFYQGEQAAIQRQQAVVVASQAAQLQAAQGNYDAAEALAEKTASLKFSDAQQKIDNIMKFIQLNSDGLSNAEKVAVSKMQAQAQQAQKQIDQQKAALSFALTNNVTQPYYQVGGTIYRTSDGKAYSTPSQFFADGGARDFGNVQVVSQAANAEKDMVVQLANKYFDAGIKISDPLGVAQQKATKSAVFRKETYIAPTGGGGGGGGYTPGANPAVDSWIQNIKNGAATLANVPAALKNLVSVGLASGGSITSPQTDQQVKSIIAANPGEWGKAADAIDAAFGKGTATKYDSWLKSVYQQGQNAASLTGDTSYTPLAGQKFATESNRIVNNFVKLPAYQAASQAQVYLPRIQAAFNNPGSIGDAELLDSIVKINTSGNAVTDAQVHLVTGYSSYGDQLNVLKNKLNSKGGALSDQQRKELYNIAQETISGIQNQYQPIYQQATNQLDSAGVPKAFWTIPDLNTLTQQGSNSSVPSGNVLVVSPDGQEGYIPQNQLQDALNQGYKQK